MADLPSRPVGLAVTVQVGVRLAEDRRDRWNGADEVVQHRVPGRGGTAERVAAHRSQVVLELARLGRLNRPVARVVDPRGEFVDQQSRPVLEPLDRQHADVV